MDFKTELKISKWRKVIFVFGILPTFLLFGVRSASGQLNYSKKEISFLKWGSGQNEIGLKEKKVKRLGFPVTFISRSGPTALETDDEGNVYLGDSKNDAAIKINPQNGRSEKIKSSKGRMGEFTFEKKIEKINPDVNDIEVLGHGRNNFSVRFKNLKTLGATCDDLICKFPSSMQNWFYFGNDKNRNIYFYFRFQEKSQVEPYGYEIVKIDLKKCSAELVAGEKDEFQDFNSRFSVDKNGNIFQAVFKKDGVHVFRWSR